MLVQITFLFYLYILSQMYSKCKSVSRQNACHQNFFTDLEFGAVACSVGSEDALGELGEGLVDGASGGLGSLVDDMANDFILGQTF